MRAALSYLGDWEKGRKNCYLSWPSNSKGRSQDHNLANALVFGELVVIAPTPNSKSRAVFRVALARMLAWTLIGPCSIQMTGTPSSTTEDPKTCFWKETTSVDRDGKG